MDVSAFVMIALSKDGGVELLLLLLLCLPGGPDSQFFGSRCCPSVA
jgi:hypothetical protein